MVVYFLGMKIVKIIIKYLVIAAAIFIFLIPFTSPIKATSFSDVIQKEHKFVINLFDLIK